MSKMRRLQLLGLAALGVVMTGCDVGDKSRTLVETKPISVEIPKPAAEAGLGAVVDTDPNNGVTKLAMVHNYGARSDAFALLPVERLFERDQTSARLMSEGGGYQNMFVIPEDTSEVAVVTEPVPSWRLSGVVIGDGVAALLDMGGKVIDIHPGMKIPDTDWVVVSIDAERAVLKRDNGKLPRMFVVPLQSGFAPASPVGGSNPAGGSGGGGIGKPGGGKLGGSGVGPGD